jgi:hypothetical protein
VVSEAFPTVTVEPAKLIASHKPLDLVMGYILPEEQGIKKEQDILIPH